MSKLSKKGELYYFGKGDNGKLYNWNGWELSRDLCDKLLAGDIVRLELCFLDEYKSKQKLYFEITKIDYYKYGNTKKIRKFHGKVQDIYVNNRWYMIGPDHTTTFRKEDIIEIPGWTSEDYNPLKQLKSDIIDDYLIRKQKLDNKRSDWEFDLDEKRCERLGIEHHITYYRA